MMARRRRNSFTYSNVPILKHSRSLFDLSHKYLTSFNVGDLVPVLLEEVYPGDTFKCTANCVIRTSSALIRPVMDNIFLDIQSYYIPSRILYNKFVNIFGENTESAWANSTEYSVPQIVGGTVASKSVADYLTPPPGLSLSNTEKGYSISCLPFRAFAKVWDDWFRDENNVLPMHIQTGEYKPSEALNDKPWSPNNYTGMLPKVAKFHDMFTSCLPAPQKGDSIKLPMTGDAPVLARGDGHDVTSGTGVVWGFNGTLNTQYGTPILESNGSYGTIYASPGAPVDTTKIGALYPKNLFADLSDVTAATVNDLRMAFQLQKMLERDARGGTRFIEYLMAHWGVQSPDGRLQRSEFLGGRRIPLNINQVTQTTGFNKESNDLGEMSANSLTYGKSRFTKSFVEHGYILTVACVRQFHTYQQGLRKLFNHRKVRTDFYDPVFANIGEQPVWKSELMCVAGTGMPPKNDSVFGYQEAWVELRKTPNFITGQMRSGVQGSMDVWHLADSYSNPPTLAEEFIEETPIYLDRALSVDHTVQDQFIADFYFDEVAYRSLPTYSVPSLIDHN